MKKTNIYSKLDFLLPIGLGANKKSNLSKTTLLAFLLFGFLILGQAQELEQIIDKHIEAHGGAEKWNAVDNMKITAQFTAFSEVNDWMAIKTKDGKYYSELSLGKFRVKEAFDGQHGWTIDPWMDFEYPRLLNKTEENVFYQKAEWMTPFLNYQAKGLELEFLGEEDLEGVAVYAIKVTRPNGNTETWYLSKDSYLEYKRVSMWVDFTYPNQAETYFEDFREVDGLLIPFYVEKMFGQRNRMLEIEKVELNVEVDETIFEMPQDENMQKLNFLLGDWDVQIEVFSPRRNRWYPMDQTTSKIEVAGNNLIEENIRYTVNFVLPYKNLFSYHAGSESYRIARYNGFSSNLNMFTGQMNDTAFMVDNTYINYGDTASNAIATRLIYESQGDQQFNLLIQMSYNQGESWSDHQKLIYTRKEN